jgi:hypothetical protein
MVALYVTFLNIFYPALYVIYKCKLIFIQNTANYLLLIILTLVTLATCFGVLIRHLQAVVDVVVAVDVDWFAVQVTPMHLSLKIQALCALLLVPSVNSRGASHHAGVRDLC